MVTHDGQAVDAEAEGKALPDLGVDAAITEHVGVHHAAAAQFEPAAVGQADVEFGRWFREREVGGAQAGVDFGAEEGVHELVDGASQVTHGDALVDDKAFELVERRQVGGIGRVGAEGASGSDDVDRRLLVLHSADLHRRGVRPQHDLFGFTKVHEDGVEAAPSRVPFRDVERLEVVPGGLDLGALGHGITHTHEHVFEAIAGLRNQMQVASI